MNAALSFLKKIIPTILFTALQPLYHFLWAFFSALWYRFPSRKLIVIGVTGTKGKTTAVELIHSILEASGAEAASLSSLRFKIGEREIKNEYKMTMPGRGFIQKFLRDAAAAGCRYAVLEVTSQGIQQFRHRCIRFSSAVMTNVAAEHIEAHGSFEKYLRAKLDLFWRLPKDGVAVINRDDPHADRFAAATPAHKVFYNSFGIAMNGEAWRVENPDARGGIQFTLASDKQDVNGPKRTAISSALEGQFNLLNIVAVLAFGLSRHLPLSALAAGIKNVAGVPGRMEWIQREPFGVMVDYAHTPDSLRNVWTFLKEPSSKFQVPNSKLICIFGATGGGRDRWKRPEMGRIAVELCDIIILTDEDPYDEDPDRILSDVESGISNAKVQISKILDRRKAIREGIRRARQGDVVVVTGKGAEPWMMGSNGKKTPWDDREIAREELEHAPSVSRRKSGRARRA